MDFNNKLLILENRFLDYKSKSILGKKKQSQLKFVDYATLFLIDDTSAHITEEEELIDEVLNGKSET